MIEKIFQMSLLVLLVLHVFAVVSTNSSGYIHVYMVVMTPREILREKLKVLKLYLFTCV